jgi:hypothetical protein
MNYTVLALVTAAALIATATLAANTPTEIFAVHKVKVVPPDGPGCNSGEKEGQTDRPDKCDGLIDQGHDDDLDEED